jgi:hypothetical protein
MGYLTILTIGAPKRTARKENRTRSIRARDRRFLTEMGPDVGYPQPVCFPTDPGWFKALLKTTIHSAKPGAESAILVK